MGKVAPADSWAERRPEGMHPIEPGVGGVLFFCDAGAAAIFDGMLAERHISDVLKFIAILHIVVQTRTVTSTEERAQDLDGRSGVQRILTIVFADKLKPRFVDGS